METELLYPKGGRRLPEEDFSRLGRQIYRERIKPTLREEDIGKFVIIDIESGDHEMGWDQIAICNALLRRHPEAQMWMEKAGYVAAASMGGGLRREE